MASHLHVFFGVFFGVSQDQIFLRNYCYIDYIQIASQQYAFFDVDYGLILEAWH